MHPFLTKLGIRAEVQEFFTPCTTTQTRRATWSFPTAGSTKLMAWHFTMSLQPKITGWLGTVIWPLSAEVFICGSAMEAIAWLHIHYPALRPNRQPLVPVNREQAMPGTFSLPRWQI
jgi:hypothetical protein